VPAPLRGEHKCVYNPHESAPDASTLVHRPLHSDQTPLAKLIIQTIKCGPLVRSPLPWHCCQWLQSHWASLGTLPPTGSATTRRLPLTPVPWSPRLYLKLEPTTSGLVFNPLIIAVSSNLFSMVARAVGGSVWGGVVQTPLCPGEVVSGSTLALSWVSTGRYQTRSRLGRPLSVTVRLGRWSTVNSLLVSCNQAVGQKEHVTHRSATCDLAADKRFNQAVLAIERYGVEWDFGPLEFKDLKIVSTRTSPSIRWSQ